jgi:hypothetical protein
MLSKELDDHRPSRRAALSDAQCIQSRITIPPALNHLGPRGDVLVLRYLQLRVFAGCFEEAVALRYTSHFRERCLRSGSAGLDLVPFKAFFDKDKPLEADAPPPNRVVLLQFPSGCAEAGESVADDALRPLILKLEGQRRAPRAKVRPPHVKTQLG